MLKIPNLKVYFKENTPAQYHYSNSERIGDIVAIAEPGYRLFESNTTFLGNGYHGYNK
jgi:hypothetical protein